MKIDPETEISKIIDAFVKGQFSMKFPFSMKLPFYRMILSKIKDTTT